MERPTARTIDGQVQDPFIKEEDGTLKIHEFEKHYITTLLRDEIEKVEEDNQRMKTQGPPYLRNAADAVERTYLRDLKAVLARVEAMPSTRW